MWNPDKEDLLNGVYDTEHVPNLLKVPGVHAVTRTKIVEGGLAELDEAAAQFRVLHLLPETSIVQMGVVSERLRGTHGLSTPGHGCFILVVPACGASYRARRTRSMTRPQAGAGYNPHRDHTEPRRSSV